MAILTPAACRAGRGLLKWGVRDLAKAAGMSPNTVVLYERGEAASAATVDRIVEAFNAAGVEITNGDGTGARLLNPAAPKKRAKVK